MNSPTDQQLLRDYAGRRSEAAFAEIVRRHIDLVYSAALRMVRDELLAQDVTQGVFVALAQSAGQLADRPVLSGWLHVTARNLAANALRTEVRRRVREQEAAAMNELLADSGTGVSPVWSDIAPHLDAALEQSDESDRDAVLLRYFEKKSAAEMADILGISDEAAQKRVSRAVDRLREFFSKRNITVGTGGLVVMISANAVQSAPVGLAVTISAAALAGTATSTSTAVAKTKVIAMTTLQKSIIGAAFVAAIGTGIYEAHQAGQLREHNRTLQQQLVPLAEQLKRLQSDHAAATNQLAASEAENELLKSSSHENELLKLRAEVTRLTTAGSERENDPTTIAANALVAKVHDVRQWLRQKPEANIPELRILSEADWLELADTTLETNALETDADYRSAVGEVRKRAEGYFARQLQSALRVYLENNNGQWPTAISQLRNYFTDPVEDAMLQRWEIVPISAFPNRKFASNWVMTEKSPVDRKFDYRYTIDGPFSMGVGRY